jgi:hypothetical protein
MLMVVLDSDEDQRLAIDVRFPPPGITGKGMEYGAKLRRGDLIEEYQTVTPSVVRPETRGT